MAKRNDTTEIVGKSVSFNVKDPDQKADLDFAEQRTNFSAFCKNLIRMERLRQQGAIGASMALLSDDKPDSEDGVGKSIEAGGWI